MVRSVRILSLVWQVGERIECMWCMVCGRCSCSLEVSGVVEDVVLGLVVRLIAGYVLSFSVVTGEGVWVRVG